MNYTYELVKVRPKQLFVQVKYISEDPALPAITRNLRVTDFSQSGIEQAVEFEIERIVAEWNEIQRQPEVAPIEEGVVVQKSYKPTPTFSEKPQFDPFTEKLEEGVDETTNTQTWAVVPKTQAERDEYLAEWRANTQCSMRQARLALAGAGLLSAVDNAIAGLPEEARSVVSIEWEYASVVDRNSPWMGDMAAALGMTDEQLDDLFKIALTL